MDSIKNRYPKRAVEKILSNIKISAVLVTFNLPLTKGENYAVSVISALLSCQNHRNIFLLFLSSIIRQNRLKASLAKTKVLQIYPESFILRANTEPEVNCS